MELMRRRRKAKGLSQAELAERMGMSRVAVNQVEMGRRKPSHRMMVELERELGLRAVDFEPSGDFGGLE